MRVSKGKELDNVSTNFVTFHYNSSRVSMHILYLCVCWYIASIICQYFCLSMKAAEVGGCVGDCSSRCQHDGKNGQRLV